MQTDSTVDTHGSLVSSFNSGAERQLCLPQGRCTSQALIALVESPLCCLVPTPAHLPAPAAVAQVCMLSALVLRKKVSAALTHSKCKVKKGFRTVLLVQWYVIGAVLLLVLFCSTLSLFFQYLAILPVLDYLSNFSVLNVTEEVITGSRSILGVE